ncbi:BMP family ABC transporter substrate-binding protein [Caenimonas aquaedulcis]|uniref:BMP family ABC transporter substrate-binding protein n=1 Tax=Caenimonas aquaedulcis TaxID=2793270 RepID=A0A931H813_9BURK|nr:BMP family ABC transporter substrate-binding protein [Caenimonas aquaedulcis]MBG9390053.1 BMP family ABC transporter substrate-binding protein [Caenimonas aquaedulcis]
MKQRFGRILSACIACVALIAGPALAQATLTIGAVYVGSVNDHGYNRSFHDALTQVARDVPGVKLIEVENVPESGQSESVMEGLVQQGAKLVIPTSFGYSDSARKVARRHRDVAFEFAGDGDTESNFGVFFGQTQHAMYAMGVAAGRMTKTNKLGFVIGVPIGYSLGNVNAFQMGAKSVNPAVQTIVVVTGGWSDKAKEASAANALLDQGCDVVSMHVDSPATIIRTVEARGAMSVGFQSIQARELAPRGWLTGIGFDWTPFLTQVAKDVMAGRFRGQAVYQGLGRMVVVAPFGAAVPPDVQAQVRRAADEIAKGFNPFTGPIKDNRGRTVLPANATVGNDQMGRLNWYVEGVVGKVQ